MNTKLLDLIRMRIYYTYITFDINGICYLYNWDATPDFSAAESLNMSRMKIKLREEALKRFRVFFHKRRLICLEQKNCVDFQ